MSIFKFLFNKKNTTIYDVPFAKTKEFSVELIMKEGTLIAEDIDWDRGVIRSIFNYDNSLYEIKSYCYENYHIAI